MTDEQNKVFEQKLKEEFEKVRIAGLSSGAKAISGLIYEKVKNVDRGSSKNDLLRAIKDIKKFCETGLSLGDNKEGEIESVE